MTIKFCIGKILVTYLGEILDIDDDVWGLRRHRLSALQGWEGREGD